MKFFKTKKTKKRILKFLVLGLVIILTLVGVIGYKKYIQYQTDKEAKEFLDTEIAKLMPILDGYPPKIENDIEKKKVEQDWKNAIKKSESYATQVSEKEQAYVYWKLGKLYALGHNLDQEGAWENAEKYLKLASEKDPTLIGPLLDLGTLYVNTNILFAPQAEEVFIKSLYLVKKEEDMMRIYDGLFFSLYYQGKLDDAEMVVDNGLKLFPDNKKLQEFKNLLTAVKSRR